MENTIKFIWDYYGEPAYRTAEHHQVHLQEFIEGRELEGIAVAGFEELSDKRAVAFIRFPESVALELKDILRPHRAVVVKE